MAYQNNNWQDTISVPMYDSSGYAGGNLKVSLLVPTTSYYRDISQLQFIGYDSSVTKHDIVFTPSANMSLDYSTGGFSVLLWVNDSSYNTGTALWMGFPDDPHTIRSGVNYSLTFSGTGTSLGREAKTFSAAS